MTDLFPSTKSTRHCDLIARLLTTMIVACLVFCGCERVADQAPVTAPQKRETPARSREPEPEPTAGHQKMRKILKHIADNPPENHAIMGTAKAVTLRSQLASLQRQAEVNGRAPNTTDMWWLHLELGQAEVHLGNVTTGIEYLRKAHAMLPHVQIPEKMAPRGGEDAQGYWANKTRMALGVAYMRFGEDQNCCARHTSESCILPIRGQGIHVRQEGSRNAIQMFSEVLNNPSKTVKRHVELQQGARWLLNIAYMTIDGYPDEVPKRYRIPPEVFKSDVEIPRFENIAPKLGLETFNLSGGAIVDDFDNDDYLDIVTSSTDLRGQMRFFRNNQDGTFTDRTEPAGLLGFLGGLNMVQADYDNDGNTDILVLRGAWMGTVGLHPNSLLRNNGNGTFTDVTFEAGLATVNWPTKTGAWADYDNDGDLDLFIGNESDEEVSASNQLFRNNGDGTFTDVAAQAGVNHQLFTMGVVWGDYNGDRFPDIYVGRIFPSRLYRNNRDGTFTNVADELKVNGPHTTFPVWFWDFDNDSNLDIYVSCSSGPIGHLAANLIDDPMIRRLNMSEKNIWMCLYRGDGGGSFEEVARQQNLRYPAQPMGANFGDLNNDGYLDFYLATGDVQYSELRPNVMFLNQGGKRFANVTMAGGFGHLQKGHGVSFVDLDNDGDQDVYVQMGGAYAGDKFNDALFENPGFGNHWITVKLQGRQSNRSAIGARIHARIVEGGKERSVYRHVNSGGSFGCNPLQQTMGLGKAERLIKLEIFWPTTGKTQVFESIPMDQIVRIIEGEDRYTKLTLKRLRLGAID